MDVHLPHRLPDEIEAVAYFIAAEALTNVAKHAQARRAVVTVRFDENAQQLHPSVFDNGVGGARVVHDRDNDSGDDYDAAADSTGLRGLVERVQATAGAFTVTSLVTGPTIISAVLPCAS